MSLDAFSNEALAQALAGLADGSGQGDMAALRAIAEAAMCACTPAADQLEQVERFDLSTSAIHADAARASEVATRLCEAWERIGTSPAHILAGLEIFAARHHVEAPKVGTKQDTDEDKARWMANRLRSPLWWRRALRKRFRKVEEAEIAAGQVRRGVSPYASARAMARAKADRRRMDGLLACMEVMNTTTGEVIQLQDVVQASLANPANRRAAMAVRLKGVEQYAQTLGMVGLFLTVTCPSRMHPSGDKYNGTTPRQANAYLCRVWANAMRKAKHAGMVTMGMRVVEPHHDACPHWHVLAFVRPELADAFTAIVRAYALEDTPDEAGAQEHRFTVERIDRAKGSALSYVMKYVSKSIDGEGVGEDDETATPSTEAARAITTWSRTHGIRQFQFFGLPPVTPVRELYRVQADALPDSVSVREAHSCIKANEQGALLCLLAMDGLDLSGDYIKRPSTRYPGELARCLVGVFASGGDLGQPEHVTTRTPGEWVIQLRGSEENAGLCLPWTRINNSASPATATTPASEPTSEPATSASHQNTPEGAPAGADAIPKEAAPCF